MSLQFFMTEFVVDLLTYFLFWVAIIFCADRFLTTIKPHKIVTTVLWTLTGLIIFVMSFIIGNPDNVFYYKRDFDMQTLETGYKFVGQYIERPDLSKYNLEDKSK